MDVFCEASLSDALVRALHKAEPWLHTGLLFYWEANTRNSQTSICLFSDLFGFLQEVQRANIGVTDCTMILMSFVERPHWKYVVKKKEEREKNTSPRGFHLSLHPACLWEEEGVKSNFMNCTLIFYFRCWKQKQHRTMPPGGIFFLHLWMK